MLVTLDSISKTFLDKQVLKNISLTVNEHDRIGLLGINGIGKSTLLNIIAGRLSFDEGTISSKPSLKIGYLKQNEALNSSNTLKEEIEDALKEVFETRRKIEEITLKISDASKDEYENLSKEYDRLTNIYNACDGHNAEVRINSVLNGMGFGSFDMNGKISVLSGGEKMRFAMCKILVQNPELLILDEPTNHLDFEMLGWLEQYLSSYKGAVIAVSHDRYFLDAVSSDICELENGGLVRYKGGYSAFLKQKEERVKVLSREYEKQQRELSELRDYVRRNIAKSSSINSVGSRVKALEKAELLAKPNPKPKELVFSFQFDVESHKTVLECRDMSLTVGKGESAKKLFQNLNIEILKGEKVAIVGRNGVGKSSFLKAILKKIPCGGTVKWGGNVKISCFDQELSSLDLNVSVIDSVHRKFPSKTEYEIRSMLARFLIEGDDVFKRVKEMSGANRAKIVFCIIAFERSNVLVLDEPTNHLDYKAKEALERALNSYEGTIIAVSHDRYLLNRVPTKIIEMTDNGVVVYNGNYDYYKENKDCQREQCAKIKQKSDNAKEYELNRKNKAEDRKRRAKLMNIEKEMNALQVEIDGLKSLSVSDEYVSDYVRLSEILSEISDKQSRLDALETQWLELS